MDTDTQPELEDKETPPVNPEPTEQSPKVWPDLKPHTWNVFNED